MPTKIKKSLKNSFVLRAGAALALGLLIALSTFPGVHRASGANCASIAECTAQINANNNAVADLKGQAVSYQDAISRLNASIAQTQAIISHDQAQQASLQAQIDAAQKQIDEEKAILGNDLRTMYVDGQISTIEALATSKNLSDFVDKEEYRNAVQRSIQVTLRKIADLQAKLQTQKQEVEALIAQEQQQQNALVAQQNQQAELLNMNQSQQAAYNADTAANQSKLSALIAAQRAANSGGGGGISSCGAIYCFIRFPGTPRAFSGYNYPYANAGFGMSTAPGCVDNDGPDQWGYCTRQCVSYAAWAVQASGRSAPYGWGNAKEWVWHASAAGIPVYTTPQPGDVAISTAGAWGHAMYVESVSGNTITVSQYNQQLTGQYSVQTRTWR